MCIALHRSPRPKRDFDRRAILGGFLAIGCSLAVPRFAFAAAPAGRVDSARGQATGLLDGALRELSSGSDVFLSELVQTDAASRLEIGLGAQTRVSLGERTRLKIEQSVVDQGGELVLERGALLFDRPDAAGGTEPVIRTPFAIIAARGTRFFVGPSNDVIGVFVERGTVAVRNDAGEVVLQAGQGTDLIAADVAPTPPKEWGAARIAAALESVT